MGLQEFITQPRVVLVPFPAQGHVTPMLHLAHSLYARGFDVTIATPDFIHRRLVRRIDEDFNREIEFASIASGLVVTDDDSAPKDFASINMAMENYMPQQLEAILLKYLNNMFCVVVDLLASWAIPVAKNCGAEVAGFWPAMLATYKLISAIPELKQRGFISEVGIPVSHQSHNQDHATEQQILPGQAKLSTKDLPWLVGNTATQISRFNFWLRILDRAKSLQWLLVNTFNEENGEFDEHLFEQNENNNNTPRVYPVGPLLANISSKSVSDHRLHNSKCNLSMWDEDTSCVEWLDKYPHNSVIYISFGSWVAPLAKEKITELALGLEATRRPFLWVLRDDESKRSGLPEGFLDRVAGHAKIVRWAPQEEVLKHQAIGCYITHCGWNSTLEAIENAKRLLCYPVSGDQFVNCAYIVEVWRIGAKPEGTCRNAILDGITGIMEGNEGAKMQENVLQLKKRVCMNCESSYNLNAFIEEVQKNKLEMK